MNEYNFFTKSKQFSQKQLSHLNSFCTSKKLPTEFFLLKFPLDCFYSRIALNPALAESQLNTDQLMYDTSILINFQQNKVQIKNKFTVEGDLQLLQIVNLFDFLQQVNCKLVYKFVLLKEIEVCGVYMGVYDVKSGTFDGKLTNLHQKLCQTTFADLKMHILNVNSFQNDLNTFEITVQLFNDAKMINVQQISNVETYQNIENKVTGIVALRKDSKREFEEKRRFLVEGLAEVLEIQ